MKISHRFLLTIKLFTGQKSLIGSHFLVLTQEDYKAARWKTAVFSFMIQVLINGTKNWLEKCY